MRKCLRACIKNLENPDQNHLENLLLGEKFLALEDLDDMSLIPFKFSDGGRKKSGRKTSEYRDCVVRSFAIHRNISYNESKKIMFSNGVRVKRVKGTKYNKVDHSFLENIFDVDYFSLRSYALKNKKYPKLKDFSFAEEVPEDCVIVLRNHFSAIKNGFIRDTIKPELWAMNSVYGYFV